MSQIRMLAIDPAFRNVGMAQVNLDINTMQITPISIRLLTTSSESKKGVRVSSDRLRRGREAALALQEAEKLVDIVVAEIPQGSQSAQAAAGLGIAIGVIASLKHDVIEVSPMEVKRAVDPAMRGQKKIPKSEVIKWAYDQWPDLDWIFHRGKLTDANEHMADALAIAVAATKTPMLRQAVSMVRAAA